MIEQPDPPKEPDFTPLLDVVFLLIFFFAMTADFLQKQSFNDNIQLPVAQFAGPLDNTNLTPVYINLDKHGEIIGVTTDVDTGKGVELDRHLVQVRNQLLDDAANKGIENPKLLVILRADKNTRYIDVYRTLNQCMETGYSRWQIRVLHNN